MNKTMERRLWNDLRCGKSNYEILQTLRPAAKSAVLAVPYLLEYAAQTEWQWGMTIDDQFLAGMAIEPDILPRRAWFCAYPSELLTNPFLIRPLFNLFNDMKRLGPYDEIRAWVIDGAEREERFAAWFGFVLDCGPASGYSPTGEDMNLWIWRRT